MRGWKTSAQVLVSKHCGRNVYCSGTRPRDYILKCDAEISRVFLLQFYLYGNCFYRVLPVHLSLERKIAKYAAARNWKSRLRYMSTEPNSLLSLKFSVFIGLHFFSRFYEREDGGSLKKNFWTSGIKVSAQCVGPQFKTHDFYTSGDRLRRFSALYKRFFPPHLASVNFKQKTAVSKVKLWRLALNSNCWSCFEIYFSRQDSRTEKTWTLQCRFLKRSEIQTTCTWP